MAENYCSPAFNQWVVGSSPTRLINVFNHLQGRSNPAFSFSPTFSPTDASLPFSVRRQDPDFLAPDFAGFFALVFFDPIGLPRFGLHAG